MQDLFVGNISFDATEDDVKELFVDYGTPKRVKFIFDKETQQFRGFGFVTMETEQAAEAAIKGVHGRSFMGRDLTVRIAQDRQPANQGRPEGEFKHRRPGGDNGNRRGGPQRRNGFTMVESLVFLMVIGLLFLGFYGIPSYKCRSKAKLMGFRADYGVVSGCMIEVSQNRYIPIDQYRYLNP